MNYLVSQNRSIFVLKGYQKYCLQETPTLNHAVIVVELLEHLVPVRKDECVIRHE